MLGGIYFIEHDIMNIVNSFYLESEEDMANNQNIVIHDATKLYSSDQKRMPIVDKSSKGRNLLLKMRKLKLTLKNMLPLMRMRLELMFERRRAIKHQN